MSLSSIASPSQAFASTPHFTRPTFLMCPPQWYGVDYAINPWMASNLHRSSRDTAFSQWKELYVALQSVADVRLLHPELGCPDRRDIECAASVVPASKILRRLRM